MRQAAQTLVPPGSRIVGREDGDCVMFADSPSCHRIGFVGPADALKERTTAVREAAAATGWELQDELRTEGATFLDFTRGGLKASVSLWADFRAKPCRVRPQRDCADSVRVAR